MYDLIVRNYDYEPTFEFELELETIPISLTR